MRTIRNRRTNKLTVFRFSVYRLIVSDAPGLVHLYILRHDLKQIVSILAPA